MTDTAEGTKEVVGIAVSTVRSAMEPNAEVAAEALANWIECRERLRAVIDAACAHPKKRTYNEISLNAGLSKGYVSEMLRTDKVAGYDTIYGLCKTLDVSFIYITTGLEIDPKMESFLLSLVPVPPERRDRVFDLVALSLGLPQKQ